MAAGLIALFVILALLLSALFALAIYQIIKVYRGQLFGVTNLIFDLENWRVSKMMVKPFTFGSFEDSKDNDKFTKGMWVSIDSFLNNPIFSPQVKNQINQICHSARGNQFRETQEISIGTTLHLSPLDKFLRRLFVSQHIQSHAIFKPVDDKKIVAHLYWSKEAKNNRRGWLTINPADTILNLKGEYKFFIGLDLFPSQKYKIQSLVRKFDEFFSKHEINLIVKDEMLLIMNYGNDLKKVRRETKHLINEITKGNNAWFFSLFFSKFGIVETQGLKYVDDIENLEYRMRYALINYQSVNQPFWFSLSTIDYTGYEIFKNAVKNLKTEVQKMNFDSISYRIQDYNSKRFIKNIYLKPLVLDIKKDDYELAVSSRFYNNYVQSQYVDFIESKYEANNRAFVTITDEKFLAVGSKLKNPNIAYIIDVQDQGMLNIVGDYIHDNPGITNYGIKINFLNDEVFSFFIAHDVKFLIISNKISMNIANERNFLYLSYLYEIIKTRGIKMIMDGFPKDVEKNIIEKAGVNFILTDQIKFQKPIS